MDSPSWCHVCWFDSALLCFVRGLHRFLSKAKRNKQSNQPTNAPYCYRFISFRFVSFLVYLLPTNCTGAFIMASSPTTRQSEYSKKCWPARESRAREQKSLHRRHPPRSQRLVVVRRESLRRISLWKLIYKYLVPSELVRPQCCNNVWDRI